MAKVGDSSNKKMTEQKNAADGDSKVARKNSKKSKKGENLESKNNIKLNDLNNSKIVNVKKKLNEEDPKRYTNILTEKFSIKTKVTLFQFKKCVVFKCILLY